MKSLARGELDLELKANNYLPGGTKEAAHKVEYVLKKAENFPLLQFPYDGVKSSKEFADATLVLLALANSHGGEFAEAAHKVKHLLEEMTILSFQLPIEVEEFTEAIASLLKLADLHGNELSYDFKIGCLNIAYVILYSSKIIDNVIYWPEPYSRFIREITSEETFLSDVNNLIDFAKLQEDVIVSGFNQDRSICDTNLCTGDCDRPVTERLFCPFAIEEDITAVCASLNNFYERHK